MSECGRGWRLENAQQVRSFQRSTETPRAKLSGECAETECEPEVFYETEESSLVHEEDLDNDDVLALEEYVAATERDMSQANRTWSEARQPLNDTLNAR